MDTTSDITVKVQRQEILHQVNKTYWKILQKYMYGKIYILTYEKIDRYVKTISRYKNTYDK